MLPYIALLSSNLSNGCDAKADLRVWWKCQAVSNTFMVHVYFVYFVSNPQHFLNLTLYSSQCKPLSKQLSLPEKNLYQVTVMTQCARLIQASIQDIKQKRTNPQITYHKADLAVYTISGWNLSARNHPDRHGYVLSFCARVSTRKMS